MKKTFIFIALAVLGSLTCRAQENYQISGKVSGMNAGTLLLVRDDGMKPDTVATTDLKNGVFVFAGKTNAPFGGYITTGDGSLTIPIVVEPANIMINVTPNGALVQGVSNSNYSPPTTSSARRSPPSRHEYRPRPNNPGRTLTPCRPASIKPTGSPWKKPTT